MIKDKIKSAGQKLKFKKLKGMENNFSHLLNCPKDTLKKLFYGTLIFAAGYSVQYLPDLKIYNGRSTQANKAQTEYVRIGADSIQNTIYKDKYIISASRPGLADTLTIALDELTRINPLTKGAIEEAKLHNQKFIIIPDSLIKGESDVQAFFYNNMVFLNEKDIKKYKQLLVESEDLSNLTIMYIASQDLLETILHELRHAQQARQGILLVKNELYNSGNLLDYTVSNFFTEGDAFAYTDFCLYGPKHEYIWEYYLEKNIKPNEFFRTNTTDLSGYDFYSRAFNQKDNLGHNLPLGAYSNREHWINGQKSNDSIMAELNNMFKSLSIPISYEKNSVQYLSGAQSIIPDDDIFQDNMEKHTKEQYKKLVPYFSVLNMLNLGWGATDEAKNNAEEMLNKLRDDKMFTLDLFENAFKKQKQEKDSINLALHATQLDRW